MQPGMMMIRLLWKSLAGIYRLHVLTQSEALILNEALTQNEALIQNEVRRDAQTDEEIEDTVRDQGEAETGEGECHIPVEDSWHTEYHTLVLARFGNYMSPAPTKDK